MPSPPANDPLGAGSLTDVADIRVGHHQRTGRGWCTGTTVVFAPNGVTAAVDVRGGGPGTRETDALDPGNLVDRIHAICLTGGSAYGLAAADGVMAWLEKRGLGVPVGPEPREVVPVVPTAVIFDLGRGDRFDNRPSADFGERALRSAAGRTPPTRGAVGAGAGARTRGLQGGVGMASTKVLLDDRWVTVAALAVVNAGGSVVDLDTGLPWHSPRILRRPTAAERHHLRTVAEVSLLPLNTTIGVVATDAELSRPEAARLARSAHDGLARAIRPAHGLTDGDAIFGVSTGVLPMPSGVGGLRAGASRAARLNQLFAASADVFATACTDAIVTAAATGAAPSYRDVCPSAFRALTS